MIFTSTVPLNYSREMQIADYLATRFTYFNRDEWLRRISTGKIVLNGSPAAGHESVTPGDTIAYDAGEFEEPAADLSYRIVYHDEWLLGVDKPGNLLVHRAGRSFRNNLIYQIRVNHLPPFPDAHPVHRLDRETSGVVVVAKNAEVRAEFGRKFNEGGIEKVYLAVVHGDPKPGEIDLPIGKKADSELSFRFCVDPAGKQCRTQITESRPLGQGLALVTIRPLSGRTHQIRVHLAAIGHPIVGDKLYGSAEAEPPFGRQALHCRSLSFTHPCTGVPCTVTAPLREDMRNLIEKMSR